MIAVSTFLKTLETVERMQASFVPSIKALCSHKT